mmetsp:Transcript_34796/g.90828  ORF Transcript_34796/g.90828 Transcript_34796/m.90828 type:complete len:227 (-) Transcript_34796:9-689(-)
MEFAGFRLFNVRAPPLDQGQGEDRVGPGGGGVHARGGNAAVVRPLLQIRERLLCRPDPLLRGPKQRNGLGPRVFHHADGGRVGQQIHELLVVDLQETHRHLHPGPTLLLPLLQERKQVVKHAGQDPSIVVVFGVRGPHGVGLARPRLPIGEDRGIVAVQKRVDQRLNDLIHLHLRDFVVADIVENVLLPDPGQYEGLVRPVALDTSVTLGWPDSDDHLDILAHAAD